MTDKEQSRIDAAFLVWSAEVGNVIHTEADDRAQEYRGHRLVRCRYGSWAVVLGSRTRFGTLAECRSDVDAWLAHSLPPAQRGGH